MKLKAPANLKRGWSFFMGENKPDF